MVHSISSSSPSRLSSVTSQSKRQSHILWGYESNNTIYHLTDFSAHVPRGFQNLLLISAQSLRVERWSITAQSRKGAVDHWIAMNPTTMNKNRKLTTWKHKGSILNNILTFCKAFVCYYNVKSLNSLYLETFLSEILIYENIMINYIN